MNWARCNRGGAATAWRLANRTMALGAAALAVALGPKWARADDLVGDVREPFPVCFALVAPVQLPSTETDVAGFRLSIFYGRNPDVMGLDIGALVSVADGDVFGIEVSGMVNVVGTSSGALQIAGIANNCYEDFDGLQISGIANMAGGQVIGGQIGCFNSSGNLVGFQIGAFNKAAAAYGLQIGVVNEADHMCGVQIGLINIIHDSTVPYMAVMNMKF